MGGKILELEGNGLHGGFEQNKPTRPMPSFKVHTAERMSVLWENIARLSRGLLPPNGDINSHVDMICDTRRGALATALTS